MKRRACLTLPGVAAIVRPIAALSQTVALPVIGFLRSASPAPWTPYLEGLRKGLNEAGYVEGTNVAIEYRWAEGHFDRPPELARDLLRCGIGVLVATGGEPVSPDRRLHWPHFEGRQAWRVDRAPTYTLRAGAQPHDRQGAWPCASAIGTLARGRGDSVTMPRAGEGIQ